MFDNSRRNGSFSSTERVVEPVQVGASPFQIRAMANGWPRLACPDGNSYSHYNILITMILLLILLFYSYYLYCYYFVALLL
jgi:hypothetical protein